MAWHHNLYMSGLYPMATGETYPGYTYNPEWAGQRWMLDEQSSLAKDYPRSVAKSPTENYKVMGAQGMLRAAIRDSVDILPAVARWREIMDRQERQGLGGLEPLATDPHAEFHLLPEVDLLRIVASHAGLVDKLGPDLQAVADLLPRCRRRWAQWLGLWRAGASPDGNVYLPGSRAGKTEGGKRVYSSPTHTVATAIYREVMRIPQTGVLRSNAWWANPAMGAGSASIAREMAARQWHPRDRPVFPAPATADSIRLLWALNIHRWRGGHIAWFERGREVEEPVCDWIRIEYGLGLTYGFDWATEPDMRPCGTGDPERVRIEAGS